ncbi:MAG: carbohydrate ABC transporter permease [Lachnospiraceae bacterium]|nr:carbohydrate ABC transporter permease [Lachnospiraceae bacterium]
MDKERYKAFSIVNVVLFLIICAFIVVPLWKVFIDSIDMTAGYGMRLWPEKFTLAGYLSIITNPNMSTPLLISVFTTVIGTLLGLILATLGAYVLIQFDMPGRNLLAGMLMFTLIFQAGMIPTYLVMVKLHLYNTLWSVIGILSINVYNLVLMRNFFEGIPKSLFEAASIDGCSPMGIFGRIVLPLSKAALASIGLMYAVAFWNDYTNFKLYISNTNLHNFQMRLRAMIFSSEMPNNTEISSNTLQNAAVMVAILPFMIVYPFCQKYFVKGINIGAVKE